MPRRPSRSGRKPLGDAWIAGAQRRTAIGANASAGADSAEASVAEQVARGSAVWRPPSALRLAVGLVAALRLGGWLGGRPSAWRRLAPLPSASVGGGFGARPSAGWAGGLARRPSAPACGCLRRADFGGCCGLRCRRGLRRYCLGGCLPWLAFGFVGTGLRGLRCRRGLRRYSLRCHGLRCRLGRGGLRALAWRPRLRAAVFLTAVFAARPRASSLGSRLRAARGFEQPAATLSAGVHLFVRARWGAPVRPGPPRRRHISYCSSIRRDAQRRPPGPSHPARPARSCLASAVPGPRAS